MGENEQGGMLRTVVVIGIIAMVALIITLGVVGLKSNMTKNTNNAVGAVVTTKVPYSVVNPDVTYKKYAAGSTNVKTAMGHDYTAFPVVGDIPNNSWREDRLVVNSSARIYICVDVSVISEAHPANIDDDDMSKRHLEVYDENGTQVFSTNDPGNKVHLDKDKDYTIIVKYFNNSGQRFIERAKDADPYRRSNLLSGTDDGGSYRLNIKSFEAATYDDKYVS